MNPLDELLRSQRDKNAEDNDTDLADKDSPAMQRFGQMNIDGRGWSFCERRARKICLRAMLPRNTPAQAMATAWQARKAAVAVVSGTIPPSTNRCDNRQARLKALRLARCHDRIRKENNHLREVVMSKLGREVMPK